MEAGSDGFAWEPTATPAPERTPWEREDASFPADLFRSWIDCLTRPSEFFASLDPDVPFSRPYLFFLIAVVLGSGLGALSTQAVLGRWTAEYYAAQGVTPPGPAWALFTFFLSPFVGWVVAPIWGLVLMVIGIRRTHDTTVGRSLAAVLIPPIVFWFAIGILFAMLVVFVVLAAGGAT